MRRAKFPLFCARIGLPMVIFEEKQSTSVRSFEFAFWRPRSLLPYAIFVPPLLRGSHLSYAIFAKKNGFLIATWTTLFAKMAISRSGLMRTALPSSIGQKRRKNSPFLFYAPANLRNTIKLSTFLRVCFLASKIASALGYLCSKSMKTPRAPKPRTAQGQGASISVMNLIEK